MARSSLFWGKARGKLGELVLYRAGGQQRSRTYVSKIKNPKTLAQMTQRVKLGSCVAFFRSTANVLRYSFPNRPQRQSGFNAFVQESLPNATTALGRQFTDEALSCPLDYHISKGNFVLPSGVFKPWVVDGEDAPKALMFYPVENGSTIYQDYRSATLAEIAEDVQRWLFVYPELSETLPMKFNICVILSEEVGEGCMQTVRVFSVDRSGSEIVVSGNNLPTATGSIVWGRVDIGGVSHPAIACAQLAQTSLLFGGAFISYTDVNGKLVVSSAMMELIDDSADHLLKYQKNGALYAEALSQLGVGTGDVLSTN